MICKIRMVLAAPGPLLTPPSSSPPRRPLTGSTPPKLRSAMETQPSGGRPQQAESGHGRPGRAPSQHRRPTTTPATARLRRGLPPTRGRGKQCHSAAGERPCPVYHAETGLRWRAQTTSPIPSTRTFCMRCDMR